MTNPLTIAAINTPADTKTTMQATAQSVGNASRVTFGGNEDNTDRNLSFASTSTSDLKAPSDILSTIRSPMGSPLSGHDIKPNSVVKVGGMETTVAAAVK